jgi:hypothetical protein
VSVKGARQARILAIRAALPGLRIHPLFIVVGSCFSERGYARI